jgi:hypothetical protein
MRFNEFKGTDNELESALVNTLINVSGDADDKNTTAKISFDAVREIMKNIGYPAFNYDVFKRLYDTGETLKNVIDDFDRETIILKTEKEAENDPEMDFDNQGSTDKVKQMAKSAMKRRQ